MTEILNHTTGEWEPNPTETPYSVTQPLHHFEGGTTPPRYVYVTLPEPPTPPTPPYVPLPPGEARRFRVIITVSWAVFMLSMLFFIALTYVR